MNKLSIDYVRNKWTYKPEFTTADTSLISDLYCSTTSTGGNAYIAAEINRKVNEIYKEREAEMSRMSNIQFNNLEKELKELGIELTTIRHSAGDIGCEIEGYLRPDIYKIYRAKERCSAPITPKKPLPKKVIFSGPATTIIWKDGTKTTVKCQCGDVWDDHVGIAMCYLKKMLGNKGNFNNIFREAMKVSEVQQHAKENITSSKALNLEDDAYYGSVSYFDNTLDSMRKNISEINNVMKDTADAINKALEGKNDN